MTPFEETMQYDLGMRVGKSVATYHNPLTQALVDHYQDLYEHHAHDDNPPFIVAYWAGVLEVVTAMYNQQERGQHDYLRTVE